MTEQLRPHVVMELVERGPTPELLTQEPTRAELREAARISGRWGDMTLVKAYAMGDVLLALSHMWGHSDRTLESVLKTVSPDLRDRLLTKLYAAGWTESEIGLPRPGPYLAAG